MLWCPIKLPIEMAGEMALSIIKQIKGLYAIQPALQRIVVGILQYGEQGKHTQDIPRYK